MTNTLADIIIRDGLVIKDSAADHDYSIVRGDLAADRTVTLPVLTSGDTFAFEDHIQTLSNKTLASPTITGNTTTSAGYLELADIAAPGNPGAGKGRFYKKTGDDGVFWKPDAAGAEIDLTEPDGVKLYDAIVDVAGGADFTSIATAFSSGNQTVFVRDGAYTESSDIVIPDSGHLVGESTGGVVITLSTGAQIEIDGSGGTKETAGTVSVSNLSTAVTGSGTTFTNLNPIGTNTFIILGQVSYLISSVTDNTNLVLAEAYQGEGLSGASYTAQQMSSHAMVSNITATGSSATGLFVRAARMPMIENVCINNCAVGMSFDSCATMHVDKVGTLDNTGNGVTITDCTSCTFYGCFSHNNGTDGYNITGASQNIVLDACQGSNNDDHGVDINGTANDVLVTDGVFNGNDQKGINTDSGSQSALIVSCDCSRNGSTGVDFDGTANTVIGCIISNNGSHGMFPGDDGTIVGCQIFSNSGNGIDVDFDTDLSIIGNVIRNNTTNGIGGTSSSRVVISGNQIYSNTSDGIDLDSACSDFQITNNHIFSNTANGILLASSTAINITGNNIVSNVIGCSITGTSDECIISSNSIFSNSSHGVSTTGDRNVIVGNRIGSNTGDGCRIEAGATDVTVIGNNFQSNTGTDFVDLGTITSLEPIFINRVDTRSATTLLLGDQTATKIEIADTAVTTEIQGPLSAIHGDTETVSGDGVGKDAISTSTYVTYLDTSGGTSDLTLATATSGQIKIITMTVAGSDAVLDNTDGNLAEAVTVTFSAVGHSLQLLYNGSAWAIIGSRGVAIV